MSNKRSRRRHKQAKKMIVSLLFTLLTLSTILTILIAVNPFSKSGGPELVYQPVVVKTGDTLWKLAQGSGLNQDTRTVILIIKKYNSLANGVIYPGQVIYIPILTSQLAYR
ncbi:MAG: LysM peptidoglycan-binding domain-containing protein [Desulfitobacteriaceae bacterium]